MSTKKGSRPRGPKLISPVEFCRDYAGGIHLSLYYRGQAQDPPRYPAPVKGIPLADVLQWVRANATKPARKRPARAAAAKSAPVVVAEESGT